MLCRFYAHPGAERGNALQLANRAADCVLSCGTRLIIVDDVHFLDMGRRDGREVANHFKWLSNQFPVTFLFVGVGLRQRGLLTEGLSPSDAALAQTARRWTPLSLGPFEIATDEGRRTWRRLLLAIERMVVLADKHQGMVAEDLAGYLYSRSTGHFASLMTILMRGCQRAIRTGQERLTRELLDGVKNDEAAELARRELEAAMEHGLLSAPAGRLPAWHDVARARPSATEPTSAPCPSDSLRHRVSHWTAGLLRTSVRLAIPLQDLVAAFGFVEGFARQSARSIALGHNVGDREALARAAAIEGSALALLWEPWARYTDAATDRFTGRGQRRMAVPLEWSRFCPACLAANGGRWKFVWRLPWHTACAGHRSLLLDQCPACASTHVGPLIRIWRESPERRPGAAMTSPQPPRRRTSIWRRSSPCNGPSIPPLPQTPLIGRASSPGGSRRCDRHRRPPGRRFPGAEQCRRPGPGNGTRPDPGLAPLHGRGGRRVCPAGGPGRSRSGSGSPVMGRGGRHDRPIRCRVRHEHAPRRPTALAKHHHSPATD